MGECKAKTIQTNLGTFRHNQAYPGIIQAYSGIFSTPCYLIYFITVVYPNVEIRTSLMADVSCIKKKE